MKQVMSFPRINPKLDKRRKLSLDQVESILIEYNAGATIRSLAKKYIIADCSIRRICIPRWKEKHQKEVTNNLRNRRATDPAFKKRMNSQIIAAEKRRYKLDPEQYENYKIYRKPIDKKYYLKKNKKSLNNPTS